MARPQRKGRQVVKPQPSARRRADYRQRPFVPPPSNVVVRRNTMGWLGVLACIAITLATFLQFTLAPPTCDGLGPKPESIAIGGVMRVAGC